MKLIINSPWHVHPEQNFVLTGDRQQSRPSWLQWILLVSSLQKPSPTKACVTIFSAKSPMQSQFVQSAVLTQNPQQSPPSNWHSRLFVSSLQYPLPINFGSGQPMMNNRLLRQTKILTLNVQTKLIRSSKFLNWLYCRKSSSPSRILSPEGFLSPSYEILIYSWTFKDPWNFLEYYKLLQFLKGSLRFPNGFIGFLKVPFGSIWVLLGSFRFLWVPLGSLGFLWVPLGSFGFLRVTCIFLVFLAFRAWLDWIEFSLVLQ